MHCGATTFPRPDGCPRCTAGDLEDVLLPRRGELWSWTVQRFQPKSPYLPVGEFEPYGVGYVSFADLCVVEGRLTTADPNELSIGMAMELTVHAIGHDAGGDELLSYAFAPVEERR